MLAFTETGFLSTSPQFAVSLPRVFRRGNKFTSIRSGTADTRRGAEASTNAFSCEQGATRMRTIHLCYRLAAHAGYAVVYGDNILGISKVCDERIEILRFDDAVSSDVITPKLMTTWRLLANRLDNKNPSFGTVSGMPTEMGSCTRTVYMFRVAYMNL